MPNHHHQKTSSANKTPLLSRTAFFKKIFWKYFQVTNEIAIVLDRRGRIVFLNKTGRKILGVKEKDALGKNWFRRFLPRREKASTRRTFQRLMRGEIKNIEYFKNPILDARGNERVIYWHNVVLKDEKGNIEGTLSSGEDITEREQAASAMRESEERYRVLFERSNDACFIADVLTRRLIDCNVQTERLTGYTRRHLLTLRADDLHPPSEVPKAMRLFRNMAAGKIISAEVKIQCRDGSIRLARVKATLLTVGGTKVLLGVFRDATERRRAEDELRDSERKYRALFDRANDAIFLMEEDRFIDCNSRTLQIFGGTQKDIIGKTPYFFSPSRQPDGTHSKSRALHRIQEALKGIPQSFEWRHKKLNGKFFDSEVSLNRIELKGRPFIQAIVRDITERKQAEQALRQSEKKYRLLFEESGDAIFVADAQTKILVDCNKKAEAMTGHSRRKILSMRADQLHPPELAAAAMKGFLKQAHHMRRTVVTQLLTKNKKRIPVSISASPLKIGGRTYLLGAFRDISEQTRTELQLKQFVSLEQATLESTADGILVVDRSGKVADFNSQFLRLWKIPQKLLASRDDRKLLRFVSKQLKDPRAFLKKIHYLYSHPEQSSSDILEFKDGRVWERYSQPQKLGGRVIGRVWSFRDVTQRQKAERELREVKRKLEYILGVTKTGVDVIDRRYNLRYVDPAWQKVYGDPAGRKCYDYFMKRTSPCSGCGIPRALQTRKTVVTEETLPRENNRVVEVHTIPFKTEDGKWMVGEFNVDITERKKAEEAIREAEYQKALVLDNTTEIIAHHDLNHKIQWANNAYLKATGLSLEQIKGHQCYRMWGLDRRCKNCPVTLAIKTGKPQTAELMPENQPHWPEDQGSWLIRAAPVKDVHGKIIGAIEVAVDITKEKQIEKEKRLTEARLATTLESVGDAVIATDRRGRVTFVNRIASQMTGWEEDAARGKPLESVFRIMSEKTGKKAKNPVRRVLQKGMIIGLANHTVLISKNGKRTPIDDSAAPIRDEMGNVVGVVLVFHDVTEQRRAENTLRESEERFRTLYENAPVLIDAFDEKGRCVLWNKECRKVFGWTIREINARKDPLALFYPDPAVRKQVRKTVLKKPSTVFKEWRPVTKQGNELAVMWANFRLPGGPVINLGYDTTERRRAEESLRASEEKLRTQIRRMPIGFITWGTDFRALTWNPAAEQIFGFSSREAVGRHAYELIVPKKAQPAVTRIWRRLLRGDQTAHSVNENRTKSRQTILCRWTNTPLRDRLGNVFGVLSMVEDITESKRAEEAVLESRRQLREIIDAVPHMIFVKDRRGRFLLVNKAVGNLYGIQPAKLIGRRTKDVHPVRKEVRGYDQTSRMVLVDGKAVLSPNEAFTDRFGERHVLETIRLPFKMRKGGESMILGVSKDVTEQRRIEGFRNEIIGTVSHEFRTPLSIEKEGVKLLLDEVSGKINPEQRNVLEVVMRGIDRLAGMVDKMLDISRIEAGRMALKKKVCDLTGVVRDVMAGYRVTAKGREALRLEENLPDREVKVFADPDRIGEVFSNLLDNSLKFTQKGTVSVTLKVLGKKVRCEVRDTGVGMSPEQVRIMFEKFRQFSRIAGPGSKGLGLGLPIAREIIQKHHGRIWAESKLGKGTRVMFVLPLYARKGVRK